MTVARHLAAADPGYAALFGEAWAACCERAADNSAPDQAEMSSRIARYLNSIGPVNNVPIGEAMVAYRERSGDEDASQTFVPFVAEVRVGAARAACLLWSWRGRVPTGAAVAARHARAARSAAAAAAGARAARAAAGLLAGESRATRSWRGAGPPGAPSPPATPAPHDLQPPPLLAREPLELQLDYWLVPGRQAEGADGKVTVKASFRALHVTRQNAHLCITYLTKEKKQKIMRLGKKKEKTGEAEPGRTQTVDGVARLICSAKSNHSVPLKVYIDGTEWNGVKFFQLSTQWQTHVKTFPWRLSRHASLASTAQLSAARERFAASIPLTESEAVRSSAGDERGSEGNSDGDITADAPVSGASVSSSPPNDVKEDKRSRLFRSATSGGNLTPGGAARKKNSLSAAERPLSAHELPVQSPTTLEKEVVNLSTEVRGFGHFLVGTLENNFFEVEFGQLGT
ncbi:phosphofurin acidic cluster sorting protein 2-like [Choristoneura fumiferana]|uniref:phosphofurin acidic cluster sorting protein 2-like n=1 Tax=Choristoneura fumiferana TaxID=7141 RepID=UPI003D154CBA